MTENKKLTSLIAGCRQMEESSQIELYRSFYSYGMSICLRYARSRESALEMLNDGFLKVFLKIDQYDSDFPFKPWLRKILINASIDHYRKYLSSHKERQVFYPDDSSSYNDALDQLEYDDLLTVLHLLSPAYRMAFNLYVVEGLSHAEIADRLDITVGSSKSNLAKARKKIKELLKSSHDIHIKIDRMEDNYFDKKMKGILESALELQPGAAATDDMRKRLQAIHKTGKRRFGFLF